jgi:ankyrin repeat protein
MAHELFEAIHGGDAERVRALVAVDPAAASARDDEGVSALLRARYSLRPEVVEALLAAGPELDLFDAAALGPASRVRELLDADGALVHELSADGFSALHLAAFFGQPGVAALLLERGADPNAVAQNPMGVAPLHSAAAAGHGDVALQLLEAGAEPDAVQRGGHTALHAAAANGDAELAELLLSYHADTSVRNEEGRTPSDLAAEHGHGAIVALLEPPPEL